MRNAIPFLALSAVLAAQQPPVLTTSPPVQTPQFGPAAFGGGVTEVAQITMIRDGSAAPVWWINATIKRPSSAFYQGWSGRATGNPAGGGPYVLTEDPTVLSLVPPPVADYFAFNSSADGLVMVFDTGGASAPAVYVRANTAPTTPYQPFGSIPGVTGYVDSQMGNTGSSWNGTTGSYEFTYIVGNSLVRASLTLTAPATVVLGAPVTMTTAGVAQHSQSYIRQYTGLPSEFGTGRALIHSRNVSSADAWFRSSLSDDTAVNIPSQLVYDDASWKANPGHIGGSLYWAYAPTGYVNPLQIDTVCMSSATVPSAGGSVTICAWAPPGTDVQAGFVMLGVQVPAIPLPGITIGSLGLNPAALVFLPTTIFDPVLGEISYTLVTGFLPRGRIDMQVGCLNVTRSRIYLGNNAYIHVQ